MWHSLTQSGSNHCARHVSASIGLWMSIYSLVTCLMQETRHFIGDRVSLQEDVLIGLSGNLALQKFFAGCLLTPACINGGNRVRWTPCSCSWSSNDTLSCALDERNLCLQWLQPTPPLARLRRHCPKVLLHHSPPCHRLNRSHCHRPHLRIRALLPRRVSAQDPAALRCRHFRTRHTPDLARYQHLQMPHLPAARPLILLPNIATPISC